MAKICSNINKRNIVSMLYVATTTPTMNLYPTFPNNLSLTKMDNVNIHFPTYNSMSLQYKNVEIQEWINFAKYERKSLIQNDNFYKSLDGQFAGFFEITWWPVLRLGNWLLYERALNQHLQETHINYEVFSGVSGSVSAPIYESICHKNRSMVEVIDNEKRTIPLYIWQYLNPINTDNQSAVVIIGINSPFYEFHNENELIFCTSICHTIEWLKNTDYTFGYKNMGVIICCKPEEVANSKRLEGFSLTVQMKIPTPVIYEEPKKSNTVIPVDVVDEEHEQENEEDNGDDDDNLNNDNY
ncbi:uncharacterized protein [Musca autumnalis]|uniref:uncharacterized protein n=1 Tax=Musca autumnalis TaxID=221902 RepID=UPI003CFB03AE